MVNETNTEEFEKALAEGKTMIVDFWAPWCGPCRSLAPTVEKLSDEFAGKAEFLKINVDENERLARDYGITGIPCIIAFKGGKIADKSIGLVPQSVLREFIEKNI